MDVLIKVGAVDDETQAYIPLCSVFKRFHNGVVAPAPRPVHVEVLKGKQNFGIGTVQDLHEFVNAVVGTDQEGGFKITLNAGGGLSDNSGRFWHGPTGGCIGGLNGRDMAFRLIFIEGEVIEHHGGQPFVFNEDTPVSIAGVARCWMGG